MSKFPRRNDLSQMTDAEKAIYHAIGEVEKVGAGPALTDVVLQLQKVKDALSDYLDANGGVHTDTEVPKPVNGKCPQGYIISADGKSCIPDI